MDIEQEIFLLKEKQRTDDERFAMLQEDYNILKRRQNELVSRVAELEKQADTPEPE